MASRDLDVDLGAVKRAAALVHLVVPPFLAAPRRARPARAPKSRGAAHALLRLGAEVHLERREPELAQDVLGQSNTPRSHRRSRPGKQKMCASSDETPRTRNKRARAAAPLVARTVAPSPPSGWAGHGRRSTILVHGDVERAVHGLELVDLVLHRVGLVHVLAVEISVPARLPQSQFADVRRVRASRTPRARWVSFQKFSIMLRISAPLGCQNTSPPPTSSCWMENKFKSFPSARWSRRAASSLNALYAFISSAEPQAVP